MDPVDVDMLSSESSCASDLSDDSSATELTEVPEYKCKYCPKRYSKLQALGGHQNAHKREREIMERQKRAMLASMNQPGPHPHPIPYPYPFPNQYALPPGFEQARYTVDGSSNVAVVYNQYIGSSNSDFARLRVGSSQGMGRGWAITGNPYLTIMPQPLPLLRPYLTPSSPPVCLDLCLGVGSSSQAQAQPIEPNDATEEMAAKKEYDLSLSLSLKL